MKTTIEFSENYTETSTTQEVEMNQVAKRLSKSRNEWERVEFDAGNRAGRLWAAQRSNYEHLRNLEVLHESLTNEPVYDWEWYLEDHENNAFSAAERLAATILYGPDQKPDRTDSKELWESTGADKYPTGHWLRGFCEGALDLLGDVEDQL